MELLFALYILLEILQYIIFADVILSWLRLFWLNIRPKFLADIIDPMYWSIKKVLPTSIWPIDFTPIVVLMVIFFITWLINLFFPGSFEVYKSYF